MSRLFDRQCTLSVDDQTFEGFRVSFKVKKGLAKEPNTAEILISNLAEATRSKLQKKGARVILQAGYKDNTQVIFIGDLRSGTQVRQGATWISKLECGDGEEKFRRARISESFAAGVKAKDVIKRVAKTLVTDTGNLDDAVASVQGEFSAGYSAFGSSQRELDKLLRSQGLSYSIQDGRLQVLAPDASTQDSAIDLGPATGLIGSPEFASPTEKKKAGHVKLKSLLQGRFKPGVKVNLDSAALKGLVRLVRVEHSGDTAGGDWFSDLEAVIS